MTCEQKLRRLILCVALGASCGVTAAPAQNKKVKPTASASKKEPNRPEKKTAESSAINEEKLKMDLARIMEYPPPDRIKRLRFFLKMNSRSALVPQATEALNAALAENGEAPPAENSSPKVEEPKPAETTTAETAEAAPPPPSSDTTTPPQTPPDGETAKETVGESQPNAPVTSPAPAAETPAEPPAKTSNTRIKNSSQLERILAQPLEGRISNLRAFLQDNPADTPAGLPAAEALVAALAEAGDEKLKAGETTDGVGQFRAALETLPADISDKLFFGVVARIPTNLYVRGETTAALEAARVIETKITNSAPRLLVLASFYLSLEQADDATRLAKQAVTLAPELAAAHQALGAAHHVALRLDDAVLEYARAVELDPKLAAARRGLADLRRATGKPDEALVLYREQLAADPKDLAARAGVVLSLFEAGKKEDAESELTTALKDEPRNLPLAVGAAYWYAAQGDGERALEYARQAVAIEPRYTWAQIALARAMLLQKRPAEAEQSLRTAKRYGRFPTLDYELANALATAGFYDEAANELTPSFAWGKDGLRTRLAGRLEASAPDFVELLAPERRASLFQPKAADTESNARMLRGLLALRTLTDGPGSEGHSAARETEVADAAREFVTSGDDATRALRQLYAGELLLSKNTALQTAL
ncbi:MAG TPA: tetratricopeptide repeat protein, partial [Pyrinomonadaceae bacterium]|nr:tetratricopeptide repeat protein [Pyrinomonadaceae bacterium]